MAALNTAEVKNNFINGVINNTIINTLCTNPFIISALIIICIIVIIHYYNVKMNCNDGRDHILFRISIFSYIITMCIIVLHNVIIKNKYKMEVNSLNDNITKLTSKNEKLQEKIDGSIYAPVLHPIPDDLKEYIN